ncbi:hypothetical protein PMZ80_007392 [Knufia obscura]|uniref:Uncharacterized protein n=2 Tax=Knufia TaxID=430999 RepID=A0AAN8EN76_9EURO|nr:hypothetical protein PMZ80_007392 [Knufia obscura]KAK5950521.1 hypothetical protein OHC33_008464 [Knufia fluminis]
MCKTFTCPCCATTFFDRCAEADFESKSHCDKTTPLKFNKRCDACKAVIGAIEKLESLVYQAPFLATTGMSGLDELEGWERDEYEGVITKKRCSRHWESKAESQAEHHALLRKMKQMGLDEVEDERKEHQGFDTAQEPPINKQQGVNSNKENEKPEVTTAW